MKLSLSEQRDGAACFWLPVEFGLGMVLWRGLEAWIEGYCRQAGNGLVGLGGFAAGMAEEKQIPFGNDKQKGPKQKQIPFGNDNKRKVGMTTKGEWQRKGWGGNERRKSRFPSGMTKKGNGKQKAEADSHRE